MPTILPHMCVADEGRSEAYTEGGVGAIERGEKTDFEFDFSLSLFAGVVSLFFMHIVYIKTRERVMDVPVRVVWKSMWAEEKYKKKKRRELKSRRERGVLEDQSRTWRTATKEEKREKIRERFPETRSTVDVNLGIKKKWNVQYIIKEMHTKEYTHTLKRGWKN